MLTTFGPGLDVFVLEQEEEEGLVAGHEVGGVCIWEEVPPEAERHFGGRHFEHLVQSPQGHEAHLLAHPRHLPAHIAVALWLSPP